MDVAGSEIPERLELVVVAVVGVGLVVELGDPHEPVVAPGRPGEHDTKRACGHCPARDSKCREVQEVAEVRVPAQSRVDAHRVGLDLIERRVHGRRRG